MFTDLGSALLSAAAQSHALAFLIYKSVPFIYFLDSPLLVQVIHGGLLPLNTKFDFP